MTLYGGRDWGLGVQPISGQAPGYPWEERVRFQGLYFALNKD